MASTYLPPSLQKLNFQITLIPRLGNVQLRFHFLRRGTSRDSHLGEYQWISSHPNSLILIGTGFDRTLGKYYADFQAANSNGTGVGNFSVACSVVTNCFTAVSLPSTIRVNPNCFPISTIVTPSSGAVNSTAMVRGFVANENGPIGGGRVTISDSRKHQLDETISDPNGYFVFDIEALGLKAALYTIEVKTDDGAENALIWALMPNENGNLIASPNPAIPEIDQQINCQIIGLSDTLSPYNITFLDPYGEVLEELEAPFPSFKLDVQGLDPGNYTILATDKTGVTWVNQVSLVLDGSPTLQIDANPVSNNLSGKILKPIAGLTKLSIRLVSITGDVVFEDSDLPASGFNINVANIPNGTYTFTAFDGYRMHTQHIVILH